MAYGGKGGLFGDCETVIHEGTFNTVEGFCYGTTDGIFGNSTLAINGGSFAYINGVLMCDDGKNAGTTTVGSAVTTFNGGSVTSYICGGSYRTGFTADEVTLNLNNDTTYTKTVCGLNFKNNVTVNDNVTVNISAGTFMNYMCVLSFGYRNNDSDKPTTNVYGSPNVYCNITGGTMTKQSAGALMLTMNTDTAMDLGRVYYNVSGGNIAKAYVGARQGKIAKAGGVYFTYSGGTIGTISTAWADCQQKYYYIGGKTTDDTKIEGGGKTGWPNLGTEKCHYIELDEHLSAVYYAPSANGGSYANDGLSAESPVQSIYDAAALLGSDGGTIYLLGDIPVCYTPVLDGTLTFSGVLPGQSEPNGYGFDLDNANMYINSDAVFDGVHFRSTKAERLIAFQGHNVSINENCSMTLEDTENSTSGTVGIIAGYSMPAKSARDYGWTASR